MGEKLADRVRTRLQEERARLRLSQREIAEILGQKGESGQSRISKMLIGTQPITLDDLEGLCFALQLPVTEAVRDRGYEFVAEMTPSELTALHAIRAMPPDAREALLLYLRLFLRDKEGASAWEGRRASPPRPERPARDAGTPAATGSARPRPARAGWRDGAAKSHKS